MFNLQILDVAIGLVFVYLLLSLISSAANEIVELWFKKRASDLERGIRELLIPGSTPGTPDLVKDLYDHALVNGLFRGKYAESRIGKLLGKLSGTKLPAYIPSKNFALALMDLMVKGTAVAPPGATVPSGTAGATPTIYGVVLSAPPPAPALATTPGTPLNALRNALATNPLFTANPVARRALISLVDAAGDDPAKLRANIEDWYNNAMDRVSGFYKRRSQVRLMVLGLFIAVTVNADSISIVKRLSTDKALRESIVAAAVDYAKANANATPTPSPVANSAKPAAVTLPNPTPQPAASSDQASAPASPASSPTGAEAVPSPVVSPIATVSPSPVTAAAATSPNASPTPTPLPGCVKDENSPECKYEKSLATLESLSLPIGWDPDKDAQHRWPGWHWKRDGGWWDQIYWHGLGWLLTALAVSLGAPFWFDLLNKFIVVRSTVKPKEKSGDEKSKD